MSRVYTEESQVLGGSHKHGKFWIGSPAIHTLANFGTSSALAVNQIAFQPVDVPFRCVARGIIVSNGNTVGTDSWTSALYDIDANSEPSARLALGTLTLTTGANQRQYLPFQTSLEIDPGLYYCALYINGNTDNFRRIQNTNDILPTADTNMAQWFYENNAGGPPATATPTALTNAAAAIIQVLVVEAVP